MKRAFNARIAELEKNVRNNECDNDKHVPGEQLVDTTDNENFGEEAGGTDTVQKTKRNEMLFEPYISPSWPRYIV